MPTERRRRKNDEDPIKGFMGSRHSVHFDDIEFQRRFEQNLIRFNLISGQQASAEISQAVTNVVVSGGGGGGGTGCYWTKEGSTLVYYEGNVGVGCHPLLNDFEVRGNVLIEAKEEQPYVEIRNWSDTAYDPVIHWSVGATPVKKFTMGVDDSDSDAWLLCSGDILTSVVVDADYEMDITYDGMIVVCDSTNHRIKKHLSADAMTYISKIGSIGTGDDQFNNPWDVCSDGYYIYIVERDNNRIQKRKLSDLSFVAKIGSTGSGNDQFNNPQGICTDGIYLYVVDASNSRIVKRLCADLSYVAKTDGTEGLNGPTCVTTDGFYLYLFHYAGVTYTRFKFACSTLGLIQRELTDGHDVHTWNAMCYADGYIYATHDAIIEKYKAANLSYVSEISNPGTGDGQFTNAIAIATDGTYLWVSDANGGVGNPQRIQKLLMDGTFVAKYGTYGSGDSQFYTSRGHCLSGTISRISSTPYRAPILKAGLDGSYVDAYPLLRARDGFQLMEDGTVGATDYVGLYAPAAITASYSLTFPGTGPAAVGHFAVSAAGAITFGQNVGTTGSPTFVRIVSLSQAIGTAPITVTSTTVCTNLNAGMVDGYHHDQSLLIAASPTFVRLTLSQAIGTAPLVVTSTTMVSNLNADLLDGSHASAFAVMPSADPGVDSILFWDESSGGSGAMAWLTPGNSVAITGTVLDTIQDIRTTASPTFSIVNVTTQFNFNSVRILRRRSGVLYSGIYCGNVAGTEHNFGFDNCVFGDGSFGALTSGHHNTVLGNNVLAALLTGSFNTGLGYSSLNLLTSGYDNVAIGGASLWSLTSGSYNVAIGPYAGGSLGTGDNCVFIGNQAGQYETADKKLFIDSILRASQADARVKALIYGIFDAATANQYLYVNANLTVPHPITSTLAIGTAPLALTSTTVCANLNADLWDGYQFSDYLDQAVKVASTPTFGGIIIANGGTIGQAAGPLLNFDDTNNYLEISGCNVGIGTTAPGEILDIVQNCPNNDGVFLRVYESGAGGKVLIGAFKEPGGTYSLPGIWFGTDAPSYTNYVFLSDGSNQIINTPAGKNIKFRVNNADIMAIIGNTGRVGINDNAPGELLDVNGNINLTGVLKVDDVQVLKEQQAAIADLNAAYAAGDLDTEAEIITALNTTNAKMNTVLAMLRTHGAIAT